MNDDQLDRLLDEAREQYHKPAGPPRDAMWAAIEARRRQAAPRSAPRSRLLWWPVGIAALLAIGFALGRGTRPLDHPVVASNPHPPAAQPSAALTTAAVQHLSQAETFLTGFRLEAASRVPDSALIAGARDLLGTTRLLLDSPSLADPRTRALLSDLEVVLAQVAQLQADPSREYAELIVQELDHQGVLPRLRTSIPAGPALTIAGES